MILGLTVTTEAVVFPTHPSLAGFPKLVTSQNLGEATLGQSKPECEKQVDFISARGGLYQTPLMPHPDPFTPLVPPSLSWCNCCSWVTFAPFP